MSELKSLKPILIEQVKTLIKETKEKDVSGELEEAISDLEYLVYTLEKQVLIKQIEKKQGFNRS